MKMSNAAQCLLLLYIAVTSYALSVKQCEQKGGVMANGGSKCYLVRSEGRGYEGAKQGCNKLGGILATDLYHHETLQALASNIRSGYAYVGIEQESGAQTRRGGWHFVNSLTGRKTGDSDNLLWDVNEPDDRDGHNEVVAALSAASARFHDAPSDMTWDYICEFGESVETA